MVSCELAVPLANSFTESGEKWQVTAAGTDAQPRPMVSVKPVTELRLTVMMVYWVVCSVTAEGVSVSEKSVTAVEMESGCEVEAVWMLSPP